MQEIILTLPYPPSINHSKKVGRLRTTKAGKLYQQKFNSPETMRFYYEVWVKIRSLNASERLRFVHDATISLEVAIDIYPPDDRRRDIDNGIKIILDSLQRGGLIANDYQIARLVVQRMSKIEHGQIILRVKPYVA